MLVNACCLLLASLILVMAESVNSGESLSDLFKTIWKNYNELEKTTESTNSDRNQGLVRQACMLCESAIKMVNQLELYSKNEDIEEVASNEMKYMLLPALLGYFLLKNTIRSRLPVVKEAENYFADYVRLCKSYRLTTINVPDKQEEELEKEKTEKNKAIVLKPPSRPSAAELVSLAGGRNTKIQRYKAQKELEKKLDELQVEVEKEHVDDEVKREYYTSLLKRWVNVSIDELESIKDEIAILEMLDNRKLQPNGTDFKPQQPEKPKPLRPFIITKDILQKQVYGLGYPGLPTVTIEEFIEQKLECGDLKLPGAEGHSMQEWAMDPERDKEQREKEDAEKEERLDKEDPDELRKAREWDEYRDDHRRGWGNRHNMG